MITDEEENIMTKILLVEDDKVISDITRYYLEAQKTYAVTCARTGGEAMAYAREQFDLIIMDILLPDTNGIDLCRTLRQWHKCPIIFSSALDDSDTMVRALEMGGDDFIAKPFDNKVLLAKIQANLRRVRMDSERETAVSHTFGPFSLNPQTHQVTANGRTVKLSQIEYRILSYFLQHPGVYITGAEIYQALWGKDSLGDTRTVQVHIHNLRSKIEANPSEPVFLKSVWGKGYLFDLHP